MALRKASAYSKFKARPFTRTSKSKRKAFIKTVPYSKIVKFRMGNQKDYAEGKHKFILRLIAEEGVQIRDNALEAGRMLIHKLLEEKIPGQYYLSVKVFPHHMLRENKTAAGAGADRVSTGMTQSFGIVIGRAALVRPGKEIFVVSCTDEKAAHETKLAMTTVKPKVPCKTRVIYEKLA